jgi:hypothetical protein
VFLRENGRQALENPSKNYVFAKLEGTNFTARIENKYYFDQDVQVNISSLDRHNPLVNVTMKPKTLYPFPEASTLIRGKVTDSADVPLEGAQVTIVGKTWSNKTDVDGRFVALFRSANRGTL